MHHKYKFLNKTLEKEVIFDTLGETLAFKEKAIKEGQKYQIIRLWDGNENDLHVIDEN